MAQATPVNVDDPKEIIRSTAESLAEILDDPSRLEEAPALILRMQEARTQLTKKHLAEMADKDPESRINFYHRELNRLLR